MKENLHKGHRQRMFNRFLETEFVGFEPHEMLEMLLFFSIPRIDTNEIAHNLMNEFNSIDAVFDADIEDLKNVDGVGEKSAILIKMISLFTHQYMMSKNKISKLDNRESVSDYFKTLFFNDKREKVRVVFLDVSLRPIATKVISHGTLGSVDIDIRQIIEFTYKYKCENIILAHNHPNGSAMPSDTDVTSTIKMYKTLKSVGINLLDHIVVSGNTTVSLKEIGAFAIL